MTGVQVLIGAVVVAGAAALLMRWKNGRFSVAAADPQDDGERLDPDDLGVPLGERATLVQFSSAFCAPCRATRQVLSQVTSLVPGVAAVEIDAEAQLDLVRRMNVLRTPTVLVLDAQGRVVERASGAPTRDQVLVALDRAFSR
ncbi:thioredoxin [Aeromicrobium sp. 636]|uniref:Thioredoxin family protein n=1 Tax=Aeromicrobium senzhongii TaxID=2663859 RepID=A0A8I0K3C6_9ACTN|nr:MULTISPECIES: thioredoxin family protein [Aeromicrobium]MBC9227215.1 thioredoxin family protein [Aeromicrobium senzhongii]MCQ3999314.1 thioredoxin [Aeromicrobium sp. 636]MTB88374.1 thioredoxin [Aeromicrobium senzhongii]QNL94653.1 thioredoxin family protein [Aeromicrobium senzhongii]